MFCPPLAHTLASGFDIHLVLMVGCHCLLRVKKEAATIQFSRSPCHKYLPMIRALTLSFCCDKCLLISSTLAWKISWVEEPGRLQSMGWLRVGHDWATSLSLFTFMHWRRKWQPTPVFLPAESQRRGSLVGCSLWRRTESDTTEAT